MIVGSGHLTHNLRDWMMDVRRGGSEVGNGTNDIAAYAKAFQQWIFDHIHAGDLNALINYRTLAPNATRAHASEEHFMPLFVALGASGFPAKNGRNARLYAGFQGAALAMDAYQFG